MSPYYQRWCAIKARCPDTLVLCPVGQFWDAYEEDARTIGAALGLRPTMREHVLTVSIPYRAIHTSIARLTGAGYRVAQVND